MPANEDWSPQEVLLALDLYLNRPEGHSTVPLEQIRNLAALIGRSEGAVGNKIANIQAVDPTYPGAGRSHKGSLEAPLLHHWANRTAALRKEASRLRALYAGSSGGDAEGGDDPGADESLSAGLWSKLFRKDANGLRDVVKHGQTAATSRAAAGDVARRGERTFRLGQATFAEGVFADFLLSVGPQGAYRCPGCGHTRLKANGDPLLEAHHTVGWEETSSVDPRWGVPLCSNCHKLVEVGSLATRRSIYASVQACYPKMLANLTELVREGVLQTEQTLRLEMEGIPLTRSSGTQC